MLRKLISYVQKMKGIDSRSARKTLSSSLWAGFGGFLGIFAIALLNTMFEISDGDSLFLIGSFGASAVLLFSTPQAEFSQPRNLLGGHLLSALVGMSIYKFLHFDIVILSALAVSLSIIVMHLTHTIHPPGGATALLCIIGGEQIHDQGYMFALSPVLLDAFIMFIVALLINNLSKNPKRHYPLYWK